MIKLGIIGAGTIFQSYLTVFQRYSDKYCIVAVSDLNTKRLAEIKEKMMSARMCKDIYFYSSFDGFISHDMDVVLIATPPETHFSLAYDCLANGKDILVEKPLAISMDEIERLYERSRRVDALVNVAYHASFAADVEWYLANRSILADTYGLASVSKIYCGFYDPYFINGKVIKGKEKLGGSYIDSGINELGVCDRIVDLSRFSCVSHVCQADENNTVIASNSVFSDKEVTIELDTGWTYCFNRKRTVLQFEDCNTQLLLDHSNQRVVLQKYMTRESILNSFRGAEEYELGKNDRILFEDTSTPRLSRQYMGVFSNYESAHIERATNEKTTIRIHKLLFEGLKI